MACLGSAEEKSVKNMVTAATESRSSRNCFRFVQEGASHPVLSHKLCLMLTFQSSCSDKDERLIEFYWFKNVGVVL